MKKKKGKRKFKVERTLGDEIIDELSLHINKKLKTGKQVDDKKNNVYFWICKFALLILYLLLLNFFFYLLKEIGTNLIYYFSVSLRSVLSTVYRVGISYTAWIINIYILYKNLKIFTSSLYYKNLYKDDLYMYERKRELFEIIEKVLKAFAIVALVLIGIVIAAILIAIIVLIILMFKKMIMLSLFVALCVTFVLTILIFGEINQKFFNVKNSVDKDHLYICLCILLVAILWVGIDISGPNYKKVKNLPATFETTIKKVKFDTSDIDKIFLKSDAKFDNIDIKEDNTLGNEIVVEFEYYKTSRVSYVNHINNNDNLVVEFNSDIEFTVDDLKSIYALGIDTVSNKTIYNYNMYKYPKIKVYVNKNVKNKLYIVDYYTNINTLIK